VTCFACLALLLAEPEAIPERQFDGTLFPINPSGNDTAGKTAEK